MTLIKNKIRIEILRKEVGNLLNVEDFCSFGNMTDEDIANKYYYLPFIEYWNKYLIFRDNKENITRVLSDVIKYDKNQPNPFEHYELQLYRAYLIVILILNGYEVEFIKLLKNYPIDELEQMYVFLIKQKLNKKTCW